MSRDQGGAAFARPVSQVGEQSVVWDNEGMSYRDWLVGKMMVEWWAKTTNLTPSGKFYMALAGDDAAEDAVRQAHKIADAVMKERFK